MKNDFWRSATISELQCEGMYRSSKTKIVTRRFEVWEGERHGQKRRVARAFTGHFELPDTDTAFGESDRPAGAESGPAVTTERQNTTYCWFLDAHESGTH